jgi:hypothetical protein
VLLLVVVPAVLRVGLHAAFVAPLRREKQGRALLFRDASDT